MLGGGGGSSLNWGGGLYHPRGCKNITGAVCIRSMFVYAATIKNVG